MYFFGQHMGSGNYFKNTSYFGQQICFKFLTGKIINGFQRIYV